MDDEDLDGKRTEPALPQVTPSAYRIFRNWVPGLKLGPNFAPADSLRPIFFLIRLYANRTTSTTELAREYFRTFVRHGNVDRTPIKSLPVSATAELPVSV